MDPDIVRFWYEMGLGWRISNCLADAGISSVDELRAMGTTGFLRLPGLSHVSMDVVDKAVGLGWKDDGCPAPLNWDRAVAALERIAAALERG